MLSHAPRRCRSRLHSLRDRCQTMERKTSDPELDGTHHLRGRRVSFRPSCVPCAFRSLVIVPFGYCSFEYRQLRSWLYFQKLRSYVKVVQTVRLWDLLRQRIASNFLTKRSSSLISHLRTVPSEWTLGRGRGRRIVTSLRANGGTRFGAGDVV